MLFLISGMVLVALKRRVSASPAPQELFNVDHKPITDALSKLPATYDGVKPDKKTHTGKETASGLLLDVPHLTAQPGASP